MKTFIHMLFSIQSLVVMLALVLIYSSQLPMELMQLDQSLYELAGGHSGMMPTNELQQPYWVEWGVNVVWAATLAFVLLLLPRPNANVSILIAIILLAAMVLAQLTAQSRHQLWLPLGLVMQFIVVSSPIILLWASRNKRWQRLLLERDHALIELASIKLRQSQPDQALIHLMNCQQSPEVAETAYDIALHFEQRRAYKESKLCYQWIKSFAPNYKDVADKSSDEVNPGLPGDGKNSLAATQSMVTPAESNRQITLGRYRIERELGRGAMGTVYLGIDPKISRQVAIKTLSYNMFEGSELEEVKLRFFREAEAAGRLTHPNIVTVFDVGEEPDLSFIAMDYIEGNSLRDYINEDSLLDVSTVYQLIAQVAEALDYAHKQNIVHRDIKPGNLLFDHDQQRVKVADFGIARIVDNSSTRTGDILGSPLYMSPEQLKGKKVNGASDIYSLGVTFYQLLTACAPYNSDSIANLAYQVTHKKHKSVRAIRPDLPASATRIINKAMAKSPESRFSSAAEMADTIHKALKKDFGID